MDNLCGKYMPWKLFYFDIYIHIFVHYNWFVSIILTAKFELIARTSKPKQRYEITQTDFSHKIKSHAISFLLFDICQWIFKQTKKQERPSYFEFDIINHSYSAL